MNKTLACRIDRNASRAREKRAVNSLDTPILRLGDSRESDLCQSSIGSRNWWNTPCASFFVGVRKCFRRNNCSQLSSCPARVDLSASEWLSIRQPRCNRYETRFQRIITIRAARCVSELPSRAKARFSARRAAQFAKAVDAAPVLVPRVYTRKLSYLRNLARVIIGRAAERKINGRPYFDDVAAVRSDGVRAELR